MNVIEAARLGKRYWTTWALRDCTLAIPAGRVAALAGPNGAGKTTLMHLAVGLTAPTEGRVTVLGGQPAPVIIGVFLGLLGAAAAAAALLAFAIGVLAGALIRRVVPAMAVTAACVVTAADLTYNRLHYWLLGQGLRLTRDQALGATPDVGTPVSGPIYIHEPAGPAPPGPAGAWLDEGRYTTASGHRLSTGAVNQLLEKHAGTGPAWLSRLHDTFWGTGGPDPGGNRTSPR